MVFKNVAFIIAFFLCGQILIADAQESHPRRVQIVGYDDHAMEPFVTRDGRYLLFNNLNQPPANTDIHFAERKDDFTWIYRGKVKGINTPDLEGCATMDRAGRMFFVSPRDYPRTLCTIYTGLFKEGVVTNVERVDSISRKMPGIVNFDVDVSPDGKTLVLVDSLFKPGAGPQSADLVMARRTGTGAQFARLPESGRLLSEVNQAGILQYAPTISNDGLTLYFTRFDRTAIVAGPQIYRATRKSADAAFEKPKPVDGLGNYVEGSALSPDEHLLYFHRKDGDRFNLYAIGIR